MWGLYILNLKAVFLSNNDGFVIFWLALGFSDLFKKQTASYLFSTRLSLHYKKVESFLKMQTAVEHSNDAVAAEIIGSLCSIPLCLEGQDVIIHADSDVVLIFQYAYKHHKVKEQKI